MSRGPAGRPIPWAWCARKWDGRSLIHVSEAATRFSPIEVWESRNPWLVERVEFAADSCGPGRHRGGLGVDMSFQMLEECYVTVVIERMKSGAAGLEGGRTGRPNGATLRQLDGTRTPLTKATRLTVHEGATIELRTGGGGGFGPEPQRNSDAVRADLREGYVTQEHVRRFYPHVLVE